MPTRILLVRHGEAECNINGIVGGPTGCTGLSDTGRLQVECLRERWARTGEVEADVLMSSVLRRARETAAILGPALGDLEVVEDCDVCELHPGEIRARVDGLLHRIIRDYAERTIIVACHGGVVMMSMHVLFKAQPWPEGGAYLDPPNTSITEWSNDGSRWALVRYADAAHLMSEARSDTLPS